MYFCVSYSKQSHNFCHLYKNKYKNAAQQFISGKLLEKKKLRQIHCCQLLHNKYNRHISVKQTKNVLVLIAATFLLFIIEWLHPEIVAIILNWWGGHRFSQFFVFKWTDSLGLGKRQEEMDQQNLSLIHNNTRCGR